MTRYFHGGPKKYWWWESFLIHEIRRIDGGRGFRTGGNVFRISGNTYYDQKNKIPMKILEFKRSGIGLIVEFHRIRNKFPNQAIWCCHCSPCCNVISQQILSQCWQLKFSCIMHNILLVCPCLCWYSVPGQCLRSFATALENAQFLPVMCTPQLVNDCFLPAMCTPQIEWFKRARSFLHVCLTTSRSMSHTWIVSLAWGGLCGQ